MKTSKTFIKSLALILGFFLFFRLGGHTPLPFLNTEAYASLFAQNESSILQMYNLMSGGALERMSVFTLGVMPYITASIITFMMQAFSTAFKTKLQDEAGAFKLERLKRTLTIFIALGQSITLSTVLLSQNSNGVSLVSAYPTTFYITTAAALITGTFCSVWIANMITYIGFGSGVSIMIMLNIVTSMPENFVTITSLHNNGVISNYQLTAFVLMIATAFAITIAMENAERRIPIIKPDQVAGSKRSVHTLKANPIGIMPPIFAAITLSMPIQFMQFFAGNSELFLQVKSFVSHGTVSYILAFSLLTFIFGFQMAKITSNSEKLCAQFRSAQFIIPTIALGKDTDRYLSNVNKSLVYIACSYIVILCAIPELINYSMGIPLYLGGTSIIIMIITSVDMKNQAFEMLDDNQSRTLHRKLMES